MPSTHTYAPGTLPAQYQPYGYEWIRRRLIETGYTNPRVYDSATAPGSTCVVVEEKHVSKNQLLFDAQPAAGTLTTNAAQINVPPTTTALVTITGPAGKTVKVRFDGIGYIAVSQFVMPPNNNYEFLFGPCPAGQRIVSPQHFDFYVEDGSCSPVAVKVTFN
jgi:hypothetical protein